VPDEIRGVTTIPVNLNFKMGKVPVRLKEVVYTLSPFQQSVMNGLWYVRTPAIGLNFLRERLSREITEPLPSTV
jgi:hypothetical protein